MALTTQGTTNPLKSLHDLSAKNLRDFITLLEQWAKIYDWSVGKEMPISRIVEAVPNATVVLLD
jgi:hypothetical protein